MNLGIVINGIFLGILGFLVVNEEQQKRKLNDMETNLQNLSRELKHFIDKKEFNGITRNVIIKKNPSYTHEVSEEVDEKTEETNPNLVYGDSISENEECSSESSSDGWKEVRTSSEDICEETDSRDDKRRLDETTDVVSTQPQTLNL